MGILVFLHGTTIMHRNAEGRTREERIRQVKQGDDSLRVWALYIPVGNAVGKLQEWARQGARICYLSPHKDAQNIERDKLILKKYAFPDGQIFYRRTGEDYRDVVERIRPLPDVIIEDDCESIGGEIEMVHPNLKSELKDRIKSIVVREFEGIDGVPDRISELAK
jgi:hypothetical protein